MIIKSFIVMPEGRKEINHKTMKCSIETVKHYKEKGFYSYTMITPGGEDEKVNISKS